MLMRVLDFIQNEILGMNWLAVLTGSILEKMGVDTDTNIGGSIHFFVYDVIKIAILLFVLITLLSYIESYFPPERARNVLGRIKGVWGNIVAALFGTVTSFCSCSSIPIFIGFTNAGLPIGVTFSFLISSPMVDFASFVLLVSIFGWQVAIVYVLTGLLIAIVGGWVIGKLKIEGQVAEFVGREHVKAIPGERLTQRERMKNAFQEAMHTIKKMLLYVIIGVAIGAVIHNWIPEKLIIDILGKGNPLGVLIAAVAGAPIYADIFQTISIAEALIVKGADLGVVLALMMSITTLSLPSMIMLKKVMRGKLLGIFILICILGIVIVGYGFNFLQYLLL